MVEIITYELSGEVARITKPWVRAAATDRIRTAIDAEFTLDNYRRPVALRDETR